MLSFMNSQLTKMTCKDKQNPFFQNVNPIKYPVQSYIWVRTGNSLFMYFIGVPRYTMKSILNVKKKFNLIKGTSSHNIYCGIKSHQVKEIFCHSVLKIFDFSQNSSFPFHWVTFDHSISCVLLVDKANKSCQNSKKKKKERNTIFTIKKLPKRKGKSITPAKTNAPILQTSSEGLKWSIQIYQMRNKKLKMKLNNFKRKYQKYLCQLVLI